MSPRFSSPVCSSTLNNEDSSFFSMGAGASALSVESPDADIKAAYEGASADERSAFLVKVGDQEKMKLASLGLDVSKSFPLHRRAARPLGGKTRRKRPPTTTSIRQPSWSARVRRRGMPLPPSPRRSTRRAPLIYIPVLHWHRPHHPDHRALFKRQQALSRVGSG